MDFLSFFIHDTHSSKSECEKSPLQQSGNISAPVSTIPAGADDIAKMPKDQITSGKEKKRHIAN